MLIMMLTTQFALSQRKASHVRTGYLVTVQNLFNAVDSDTPNSSFKYGRRRVGNIVYNKLCMQYLLKPSKYDV